MNVFLSKPSKRKKRSEKVLAQHGVRINPHLPVIEDDFPMRSVEEVAKRALCVCLTAVKGEGLEQETVLDLVEKYNLADSFTPGEKAFIYEENPSKHDRIQFTWKYECYWVLLWSLGYVDTLAYPDTICDVPFAVQQMADRTTESFIQQAVLRTKEELLDEGDLIFRLHWAVRQAHLDGTAASGNLDGGVVMERHYALNWLIRFMDQEWDDVETHT
ncbi:DUF4272 domain-containing protein [Aneurinibacillus sp. REN35]|uniref:DUF4272 domain-containing protein n=1 Tax=Aneurinibacillus sp. REN35 TaxID=3237286 RepID=UPI003529AD95